MSYCSGINLKQRTFVRCFKTQWQKAKRDNSKYFQKKKKKAFEKESENFQNEYTYYLVPRLRRYASRALPL
jgi:hypothetical protein